MLTEKQKEMLEKKFKKGYTLSQLCDDLDLNYKNLGNWKKGNLTEMIKKGDYLEYLTSVDDLYIYRPMEDRIDDFLEDIDYEPEITDFDWTDRNLIVELLKYLKDYGLLFRLIEELEFLGN